MFCRTCGKEVAENAIGCMSCGMRPLDGNEFCPSCAAPTKPQQVVCIKCGVALTNNAASPPVNVVSNAAVSETISPSDPPKDPVLMGLLSGCCIAGLGQILIGQTAKGVLIMLSSLVLGALTAGLSMIITWPAGGIDAYMIAQKLKEGKTVGKWEWF